MCDGDKLIDESGVAASTEQAPLLGRVLIVEDDLNQCLLYERELSRIGYQVFVAHDGWEAIGVCETAKPDVVILDIGMPMMDGIEVMDRLLAINHRLAIILYTAYSAYGENYRSWAADAYVVKSSDLSKLKQAIHQVLGAKPFTV